MIIDYKKQLNDSQYQAVSTTEGPVLMLAAAGTGKTRSLVHRVAYLVESGVPACNILLLTFTNKAADEMKERAEQLLDGRCGDITACTYHSFCTKMLRRYAKEAGLQRDFTIITGTDVIEIINMVKTDHRLNEIRGFPKTNRIAAFYSASINLGKTMEELTEDPKSEWYRWFKYMSELKVIKAGVMKYKRENNLMDYDDLLVAFRNLIKGNKKVRDEIADMYEYIMVDEYQDTNKIQDEILFLLRLNNKNLAVVGDDSQSLYGFRGADVKNIIRFPDKTKDCKIVSIMDNYRSDQEILNVANYAIDKYATEGFKKKIKGQYSSGKLPKEVRVKDVADEAYFVVDTIRERFEDGCPPGEICVLARNSNHSAQVEIELNKEKIPFVKYGGPKFLEKEHIKDILCFLRVLTNGADEIAWFRLLKLIYGIGDVYARDIAKGCKMCGMNFLIDLRHTTRVYYDGLCDLHENLEKAKKMEFTLRLPFLCTYYINLRKLKARDMKVKDESTRTEEFENIKTAEKDFEILKDIAKSYTDAVDFLDCMTLDEKEPKEKKDQIVVSTIHSAKGLEYDTVFVLACADGVFPRTAEDQIGTKQDNEELRCFYVAVTRAKTHLYLMVPKFYRKFGSIQRCSPSHYFFRSKGILEEVWT